MVKFKPIGSFLCGFPPPVNQGHAVMLIGGSKLLLGVDHCQQTCMAWLYSLYYFDATTFFLSQWVFIGQISEHVAFSSSPSTQTFDLYLHI